MESPRKSFRSCRATTKRIVAPRKLLRGHATIVETPSIGNASSSSFEPVRLRRAEHIAHVLHGTGRRGRNRYVGYFV